MATKPSPSAAQDVAAGLARRPSALRFTIPLVIFALLVFFLWRGLSRDPREVPSVLVDKPAPAFGLPVLGSPGKTFSPADYRGKVWLLNVWGSWCISCPV